MALRPFARNWDRDKVCEVRRFFRDGYSPEWIAEKVAMPLDDVTLLCEKLSKDQHADISFGDIPGPIPVDEELAERIAAVRRAKLAAKRAEHSPALVGPPRVVEWIAGCSGKRRR